MNRTIANALGFVAIAALCALGWTCYRVSLTADALTAATNTITIAPAIVQSRLGDTLISTTICTAP